MTIDDSTWSLVAQIRAQLNRIHDEQVRSLVAAWVKTWDDVSADLTVALQDLVLQAGDGKITRSAVMKSQRLANALGTIETRLNGLFEQSGQQAIAQLGDIVNNAGATQERLIAGQLPPSERAMVSAWSRVDDDQIEAIVRRSTEQITKRSFPLADEATATMRRALVKGMVSGSNPRTVAADMVRKTEGIFNGGLSRALTIARTEQLDAHRTAAKLAEKSNTDILECWIWSASLGSRTCPACWGMNGTEHPLDESGPEGHQNCRCVRIPKTKTWRELGFDIDEPPSLQPDPEAAFNSLSREEQVGILGGPRYTAWRAGNFPMSAWAQKKDNPGWRPSWVTAKPTFGKAKASTPAAGSGSGSDGKKPPRTANSGGSPISSWTRRSKAAINQAPESVRDAIEDYSDVAYLSVNKGLRSAGGKLKALSKANQTLVKDLDTAVNLLPFDADMKLSRLVDPDAFGLTSADQLASAVGRSFTDHGFISTSRRSGKSDIRYTDPILLDVLAPTGTPAASISHLALVQSEREVLLGRGLSYILSNARYDSRRKMWRATMLITSGGGAK